MFRTLTILSLTLLLRFDSYDPQNPPIWTQEPPTKVLHLLECLNLPIKALTFHPIMAVDGIEDGPKHKEEFRWVWNHTRRFGRGQRGDPTHFPEWIFSLLQNLNDSQKEGMACEGETLPQPN